MAELESMKYFSPDAFAEESPATPAPAVEGDPERLATAAELGMSEWTATLTVVVGFFAFLGAWGLIGSGVELIGIVTLESSLAYAQKMGNYVDNQYQLALVRMQIDNQLFLYFAVTVRFLVAAATIAAAAMLRRTQEDANRFAAFACIGAVFYALVHMLCIWTLLPDPTLIPGVEAADADMVNVFAMLPVVLVFGFQFLMYGLLLVFFLNKSNRRLFGRKVSTLETEYTESTAGQVATYTQ